LKRGLCATIKEFLMAAEYIASGGNYNIILCERGIRSFDTETRNVLDLSAIPVIKAIAICPLLLIQAMEQAERIVLGLWL